ncbi:MAG: YdiU family protein [Pseudomonadota bacterium]
MTPAIAFDNTYARLPERFFVRQPPVPVRDPKRIYRNDALAEALGIDAKTLTADVLAGNAIPEGADPLAMAYAGHQFGGFTPQLGDGRALLIGEVLGADGARRDIQLKGSGRTPFSRSGDGRAALGPVLREVLIGEAMAALGIPTTRALAAVTTGEPVLREEALPGAILTRVAASHIRVGTFQYFAARRDSDALKTLVDYVNARHAPSGTGESPAERLFHGVIARQASLIASWMAVGFIHGVMNTDNMALSGETIDYGPCAFMDSYDPATVYSSIDHGGRYAYANQPAIAGWNLARLAETLLPLFAEDEDAALKIAQAALDTFAPSFQAAHRARFCAKLALAPTHDNTALVNDLLSAMHAGAADFTLTFAHLDDPAAARALFTEPAVFDNWHARWSTARDPALTAAMAEQNPRIIPRNHLVEAALDAATEGDLAPFEALHAALKTPFDRAHDGTIFATPPKPYEVVRATFCGT